MTVTPVELDPRTGVYLEAEKLLGFLEEAATTEEVTLPARKYVTAGQAAYDCEQVTSTMVTVLTGLPGATIPGGAVMVACPLPWQIIVELAIVRCAPVPADDGTPPTPGQFLAAAQTQARDAYLMQQVAASRTEERFGGVAVTIGFPAPSGGMMATVGRFTVSVTV